MNIIPLMLDPSGKHWEQPKREEIEIDDTHVLMSKSTFYKLHDYSRSQPTGVYHGKMWKSQGKGNIWYLRWFGVSKNPDLCSNNVREIIIEG